MKEQIIFTITAGGLMLVEILLIFKVHRLTKVIQHMNENIDQTQEFILSKIRAVVDLFLKAKGFDFDKFKGGSAEFSTGKTKINLKVKKQNGK